MKMGWIWKKRIHFFSSKLKAESSSSSSDSNLAMVYIFTAWILLMAFMYMFWPQPRRQTKFPKDKNKAEHGDDLVRLK